VVAVVVVQVGHKLPYLERRERQQTGIQILKVNPGAKDLLSQELLLILPLQVLVGIAFLARVVAL
jgi:hypothetical protein